MYLYIPLIGYAGNMSPLLYRILRRQNNVTHLRRVGTYGYLLAAPDYKTIIIRETHIHSVVRNPVWLSLPSPALHVQRSHQDTKHHFQDPLARVRCSRFCWQIRLQNCLYCYYCFSLRVIFFFTMRLSSPGHKYVTRFLGTRVI